MKQNPGERASRSMRARRTQPALLGITMPTTPVTTPQPRTDTPQPVAKKQPARSALWRLLALGLLLALLYFALYPLFDGAIPDHEAAKQALLNVFPWLAHLYWTEWTPAARVISYLAPFNLNTSAGFANLLLVGLALVFVFLLMAARVGRKAGRERLTSGDANMLFWTIMPLTALLSVIFLFAPAVMWPQVFEYGLYGRMVTVIHVNPYAPSHVILPTNLLYNVIAGGQVGPAPYGPLWLDLTLPVTLLARDSVANILIGFRLFGLLVHLANTLLLWQILGRLRAERRIAGTLLYAWNPVVLLLGVAEMHYELVVILFVLLASYFYLRRAFLLGWICVVLATLMNPLCLLLLPLFLRILSKETRMMQRGQRALWWLLLIGLSLIIAGLAYYPYWPGQGIAIITTQLRQAFLPETAINSLNAAIQHLQLNARAITWIASPLTWNILALVVAASLLLLGIWLVENLELTLLFACWVLLAIFALAPQNWPWDVLLLLTLAICSNSARTILLAFLLTTGAALSYYFWLGQAAWPGQALVTIGLPLVIWGWWLFLASTWRMTRGPSSGQLPAVAVKTTGRPRLSRPSWPGRPTWPGRK
ncbi:MAG TPA: hypothetical protein VFQ36_01750 [Ktedonobacteraceae bacterium]|nr:hypothetical protein [Ktedonobacteraceae bacterium]